MLICDLCDFNDVYIVVKGKITASATGGANNIRHKKADLYHLKIMHYLLNKWCFGRKCRRLRYCNANVQFA